MKGKGVVVCYHDIASNVGDLQGQRQHVELTHDLEDQLGVCPCQLQQVEQVRRVTETQTHTENKSLFWIDTKVK